MNNKTVSELKKIAKELQIDEYYKMNKSQLVSAIDNYVYGILYIYPKNKKSDLPVNDDITKKMSELFENCHTTGAYNKRGDFVIGEGYMGVHTCKCGETSESVDYLLTPKFATNSLCVHYLQYHRDEIPETEFEKINELLEIEK